MCSQSAPPVRPSRPSFPSHCVREISEPSRSATGERGAVSQVCARDSRNTNRCAPREERWCCGHISAPSGSRSTESVAARTHRPPSRGANGHPPFPVRAPTRHRRGTSAFMRVARQRGPTQRCSHHRDGATRLAWPSMPLVTPSRRRYLPQMPKGTLTPSSQSVRASRFETGGRVAGGVCASGVAWSGHVPTGDGRQSRWSGMATPLAASRASSC